MDAGSKALLVISATDSCSWYAFSAEITGAYELSMKWMRGYGTKFVWNSVTSTFSAPSKRSDAVSDEMTCAIRRFRWLRCPASRPHPCAPAVSAWTAPSSEFTLAAVVDRQTLQQQSTESGAGAATDGVEHQETLQTRAVVGQLADAVEHQVDDLLPDGVVATRVVVGGVLLARDDLLRVVELAVGASAHLVTDAGLEVDEHSARHVLASAGLGEEGVEGVVSTADGLVAGHLAVGLDAVLEAVELPAGVTGLNASLAEVDGNDLTHLESEEERERESWLVGCCLLKAWGQVEGAGGWEDEEAG
ncbi:hypothetical protein ON010_g14376 [Phytophthora cinnamomi]|nr:hypothetical protein ON010_g14376 [Phytophthora cinnamomi]